MLHELSNFTESFIAGRLWVYQCTGSCGRYRHFSELRSRSWAITALPRPPSPTVHGESFGPGAGDVYLDDMLHDTLLPTPCDSRIERRSIILFAIWDTEPNDQPILGTRQVMQTPSTGLQFSTRLAMAKYPQLLACGRLCQHRDCREPLRSISGEHDSFSVIRPWLLRPSSSTPSLFSYELLAKQMPQRSAGRWRSSDASF